MSDLDLPIGCLIFPPPRGSLRLWLAALGTVAALLLPFYLLFSWLGW